MERRSRLRTAAHALPLAGIFLAGHAIHHTPEASSPAPTRPLLERKTSERAGISCDVEIYAEEYNSLYNCNFIKSGHPGLIFTASNLTTPGERSALFLLIGAAEKDDFTVPLVNWTIPLDLDIERVKYEVHYPEGWTKHGSVPVKDLHFGFIDGESFYTKGIPDTVTVVNSVDFPMGTKEIREPIEVFLLDNPPPAASDEQIIGYTVED